MANVRKGGSTVAVDVAGNDMMKEYEVMVTEKLVKTLSINADTKEQAIEKVERMLRQEELILTAEDYDEREIDVMFENELDVQEGFSSKEEPKAAPVVEPEVSLYVACCGEFHNMAPMYESILDANEALKKYDEAVKKFSGFIPEIGIKVSYKEHPEQDVECGLLQGNVLDLSMLDCVEGIANIDSALHLIGELVSVVKDVADVPFPNYQINGESVTLNKALTTICKL